MLVTSSSFPIKLRNHFKILLSFSMFGMSMVGVKRSSFSRLAPSWSGNGNLAQNTLLEFLPKSFFHPLYQVFLLFLACKMQTM